MTFTEEHISAMRDQKQESKDRRARNRKNGLEALRKLGGLHITVRNQGSHLIVRKPGTTRVYDYWPGTGLWRMRREMGHGSVDNGLREAEGRGIQNLIQQLSQLEIKT